MADTAHRPPLPPDAPAAASTGADSPPAPHLAALDDSRRRLLAAVAGAADLTFVRGVGNLGDELIYAGTRRLLAGVPCREIALDQVPVASGHTALLAGGGAWCRPYHELMPLMLPLAELRFERVIVLPSSFDLEVEEVRGALSRSRALVFARERESYRQIREVCAADLALDCAFFFDYTPFRGAGDGELLAMRDDREAVGPAPDGSNDISRTCSSLDEWLWTIARHATVVTDRAHVMIAAALLGKRVEWSPSSYHKLEALAEHGLEGFDVRRVARRPVGLPAKAGARAVEAVASGAAAPAAGGQGATQRQAGKVEDGCGAVRARLLERARQGLASLRPEILAGVAGSGVPRLTVIVLTRDRPHHWQLLLRSLRDHVRLPYRLLMVDNNSAPAARAELSRLVSEIFPTEGGAAGAPAVRVEIVWGAENRGCAAARHLAVERADTEYVMFLDDDAEVFPGALEHLAQRLDGDPTVLAAGGHIVLPDGRSWFCGGEVRQEPPGLLHCEPLGFGLDFEDPAIGAAGACGWLAGCALLIRRSVLLAEPLDLGMDAYYEDTEWSYRLGLHHPRGVLRREPAALVLHHHEVKGPRGAAPGEILAAIPFLQAIAHFYRVHGLILDGVFAFAPELARQGRREVAAARLLLELLLARGGDWLAMEWLRGGLAPLLAGAGGGAADAVAGPEERPAAALREELARARGDLATHSHELAVVRGELVVARHELLLERGGKGEMAAMRRELAAIQGSRAWRLVRLYWRLRRAVGRLFGGQPRQRDDRQAARRQDGRQAT